ATGNILESSSDILGSPAPARAARPNHQLLSGNRTFRVPQHAYAQSVQVARAWACAPPRETLSALRRFRHVEQLSRTGPRAAPQLTLRPAGRSRRRFGRLLALLLGPVQPFAAEADLAVARIDAEDLDLDLVADFDDLFGALDLVVGQL